MMFPKQGKANVGFLPAACLATWQGRATDLRVPASFFPSAYPCGPP
ncbi:hypothetical protein phi2LM21_p18 [Sinorhizobium phage phi2LM21]|nr:hypothetical protein phi2LM21_p18 [Sinorhizobium phage phi2LM21]